MRWGIWKGSEEEVVSSILDMLSQVFRGQLRGRWLQRCRALAWGEVYLVSLNVIIGIFIDVAKIIRRES